MTIMLNSKLMYVNLLVLFIICTIFVHPATGSSGRPGVIIVVCPRTNILQNNLVYLVNYVYHIPHIIFQNNLRQVQDTPLFAIIHLRH
jgi:hypothetical protein